MIIFLVLMSQAVLEDKSVGYVVSSVVCVFTKMPLKMFVFFVKCANAMHVFDVRRRRSELLHSCPEIDNFVNF